TNPGAATPQPCHSAPAEKPSPFAPLARARPVVASLSSHCRHCSFSSRRPTQARRTPSKRDPFGEGRPRRKAHRAPTLPRVRTARRALGQRGERWGSEASVGQRGGGWGSEASVGAARRAWGQRGQRGGAGGAGGQRGESGGREARG